MTFDLWYHDGTGFGWPALETRRSETTVDETRKEKQRRAMTVDELMAAPVAELREKALAAGVQELAGLKKADLVDRLQGIAFLEYEIEAATGNTVTTILRDLIVFYTGPKNGKLSEGVNVLHDVPEGAPVEAGTCSHIAWQPGTEMHAKMVLHGIAEGEAALIDETAALKAQILENELALEAVKAQRAERIREHGIQP